MKAGLMLHMSLIELASIEQWDINLILVTVPDEEVNSSGMRKAVEKLAELKANYDLDIQLHLNSEPTFQQATSDENIIYIQDQLVKSCQQYCAMERKHMSVSLLKV